MHIYLSGSSGLIGTALRNNLESDGHCVTALPRTYEEPIDFSGIDVVIHLAGEPIAEGRWTDQKKRRIEESRVGATHQLAKQLAETSHGPSVFISASAIGFYGECGDKIVDEDHSKGTDFLAEVCTKWEQATVAAQHSTLRVVHLRTGVVLSNKGGALKKMLLPFKMGAGGRVGSGQQYMSWISLDDMVQSIRFIIKNESISGAVNLVAPTPVTNREFTKILGKTLHRLTWIPLPAFVARLLFGEMADALLLSSTRVKPKKLMEAGYPFKHTTLQSALEDILR